jgi:ketosteroid isomerase-like protein
MEIVGAAHAFIASWARAQEARDVERLSDLFLRDPDPMVTFSDGERVRDWLDVRIRLQRDLERHVIDRVEVHDIQLEPWGRDAVLATFAYDITVRDLWGTSTTATRLASLVLVETKDGLRVALAHFSAPR